MSTTKRLMNPDTGMTHTHIEWQDLYDAAVKRRRSDVIDLKGQILSFDDWTADFIDASAKELLIHRDTGEIDTLENWRSRATSDELTGVGERKIFAHTVSGTIATEENWYADYETSLKSGSACDESGANMSYADWSQVLVEVDEYGQEI